MMRYPPHNRDQDPLVKPVLWRCGLWSARSGGFTLIEMMIVLTVFGLVMVGAFEALRVQTIKHKIVQTQEAMQEIQQALLGFVTVNGRLPCAAANPPGLPSDLGSEACPLSEGFLPWVTLGVKPIDPWGNTYDYYVTADFNDSGTFLSPATPSGDLAICQQSDTVNVPGVCNATSTTVATNVAVLVVSYGRNQTRDSRVNETKYRIGTDDTLLWIPTHLLKYQEASYSP